jgi:nucleoside-diphosphate-sugar epimerase
MKKVLLTGSSGFIGRHAIPLLQKGGYDVHAVYYPEPIDLDDGEPVTWHKCDLLDAGQQQDLIEEVRPTHLLHFAWYTAHGKYWTSEENLRWLEASTGLFRRFAEGGGKRAVSAGTCAEYDWDYGYCSEDVTPTRPKTLYGSFAWGRIFFLYGPYEVDTRLVPIVITSLLKDQEAKCTHGNQFRDFMHVQDVASAFVSLLESSVEGSVNIASGVPVALKTVLRNIASILNKPELVKLGAIPVDEKDPPLITADVRRLNNAVGWKPSIDLEAGLRSTIEWWRENLQKVCP